MPGMGMSIRCSQRLEQSQTMRMTLRARDMIDPFSTGGEEEQVSQYKVLKNLLNVIDSGEFFDSDHFSLGYSLALPGASPCSGR